MNTRHRLSLLQLEDRSNPTQFGIPWPNAPHLTLSFVPDGTPVGTGTSNLDGTLDAAAARATWETLVLRAYQTWAVQANVNIALVPDGGQPMGATGSPWGDPRFGDVRIAGTPLGGTWLASTTPFDWSGSTWAGDVVVNTGYGFGVGGTAGYDLFSTMVHEAGHSFGLPDIPTAQVTDGSVMADTYSLHSGLSPSDIANLQALYGGPRSAAALGYTAGNTSPATAVPLAGSTSGDISTIGGANYYKVTVPAGVTTFTVNVQTSGISLLVPAVTVTNASNAVVGSAAASSPLNGNVGLQITGATPGATYYVRVGSGTKDVFGVGSYAVAVSYPGVSGSTGSAIPSWLKYFYPDWAWNSSPATAIPLGAITGALSGGFTAYAQGSLSGPTDLSYFKVQSPATSPTGSYTLTVLAWSPPGGGGLQPEADVFDATGASVPSQVLLNANGSYSVQVPNAATNATYYVRVKSVSATQNTSGLYNMGVFFGTQPPVALTTAAQGQLAGQTTEAYQQFTLAQGQVDQFVLAASAPAATVDTAVKMTIYNSAGVSVFSLTAYNGQPASAAFVDLPGGTVLELLDYRVAGKRRNPEETANPGSVHLCLLVDDARSAWERAVALGARPLVPDGPVDVDGGPNLGARAAYLRIHDGITLELYQPPPR